MDIRDKRDKKDKRDRNERHEKLTNNQYNLQRENRYSQTEHNNRDNKF